MADIKADKEQEQVINDTSKRSIVIAGPGAGKTRTLMNKAAFMISHGLCNKILLLTFTNNAASEMQSRFADHGIDPEYAEARTINSLAYQIVNENQELYSQIIDTFIKGSIVTDNDAFKNKELEKFKYEYDYLPYLLGSEEELKNKIASTTKVEQNFYEALLQQKQKCLLDQTDIINLAVLLLKEHSEVRENYQSKWDMIEGDEWQDVSLKQFELVSLLVKETSYFTVFFDDDQNIYAWRNSISNVIDEFKKFYPDAKIFLLTTNYRSTGSIVKTANAIICNNKKRYPKTIKTNNQMGDPVEYREFLHQDDERAFIKKEITKLITKGYEQEQIAILCRANNTVKYYLDNLKGLIPDRNIMTCHSSKGTEFDVVFIPQMSQGRFPDLLHYNNPDQLESDRRLFYVAATRARLKLYLSYSARSTIYSNSEGSLNRSVFIDEIINTLRKCSIRRQVNVTISRMSCGDEYLDKKTNQKVVFVAKRGKLFEFSTEIELGKYSSVLHKRDYINMYIKKEIVLIF